MHVLLDTHAFLWWLDGDERLAVKARRIIQNEKNVILVSAASAWEVATKVRIGKLPGAVEVAADFIGCLVAQSFTALDITVAHAQRAGLLPGPHRDPFDRMLIAQAQAEDVAIISSDEIFDVYRVRRLW
jgi:PIN domain nuclease of toxin-antitoxin system